MNDVDTTSRLTLKGLMSILETVVALRILVQKQLTFLWMFLVGLHSFTTGDNQFSDSIEKSSIFM